ncbi:MAG: enoyl-CoA hydratase-related protein [Pseudomonadota bacterium]
MTDPVLEARVGAVTVLTMNRPSVMNALSQALRTELAARIVEASADDDVRVIVLTGADAPDGSGVRAPRLSEAGDRGGERRRGDRRL